MSLLGGNNSGGGISPEQLAQLVDDAELAIALQGVAKSVELAPLARSAELAPVAKTADLAPLAKTVDVEGARDNVLFELSTVYQALQTQLQGIGGAPIGSVQLFNTLDGQAPANYERSSGMFFPAEAYGAVRFSLSNSTVAPRAVNSTKVFNAANAYYDVGLGTTVITAAFPVATSTTELPIADEQNLYTFGHITNGTTFTGSVYRFSIAANTWTLMAAGGVNAHMALNLKGGARLADGKFLIIGGNSGATLSAANLSASVTLYDPAQPAATAFTARAPLPVPAASVATTLLANGDVFAIAFLVNEAGTLVSNSRRTFIYSVSTDAWTEVDVSPQFGIPYLNDDGSVMIVANVLANSQRFDRLAPTGAQFTAFAITAPVTTGAGVAPVLVGNNSNTASPTPTAIRFGTLLAYGSLPVHLSVTNLNVYGFLNAAVAPRVAAQSFYATKVA